MAGEISNVSLHQPSNAINEIANMQKGMGLSQKSVDTVKDVAAILSGKGVNVTSRAGDATETGKATGPTSVPVLDNPDDAKAKEANLEKLIAFLQLDNEERQAEMAKDRIEINKNSFDTEHTERKQKIEKSLKEMEKAEKAAKARRVFGWLMTALAVVAAVVACVATGGIAVGAVVGAAVAVGMQVLNETGVIDKLTEKLASALEKAGMSKQAAQILAAVLVTAAAIALSIGSGAAASSIASSIAGAASKAVQVADAATKVASGTMTALRAGAEAIKPALTIGTRVLQVMGIGLGAATAYQTYKSGMAQADVTDTEKLLAILRQRMEESEEELNQILESIQNAIADTAHMLSSATDTSEEIAGNIGRMA